MSRSSKSKNTTPRQKLLKSGEMRDISCSTSLRVPSLSCLRFSAAECFTVRLIGDSPKCKVCHSQELCKCLRDHFQSTTNSKRRVSTFLFWKNKLGLAFPVSDEMVKTVWKGLESCENGIKPGNGQRKMPKGPVCVNPFCYFPNDQKWNLVLPPFINTLRVLGMHTDAVVAQVLQHLKWAPDQEFLLDEQADPMIYKSAFDVLTARVRKMVEDEKYIEKVAQKESTGFIEQEESYDTSDTGYDSSASGRSPIHASDYFNPESPPEFLSAASSPGYDQVVPYPSIKSEDGVSFAPHTHEVPEDFEMHSNGARMGTSSGLHNQSNEYGPRQYQNGNAVAPQALLPFLQQRQWTEGDFAAINEINASLQQCIDDCDVGSMDYSMGGMSHTENDQGMYRESYMELDDISGVLPYYPYMNSQVQLLSEEATPTQMQQLHQQAFSAGFDIPQEASYGWDDLHAVAPGVPIQKGTDGPIYITGMGPAGTDLRSPVLVGDAYRNDAPSEVETARTKTEFPDVLQSFCKKCNHFSYAHKDAIVTACSNRACGAGAESLVLKTVNSGEAALSVPCVETGSKDLATGDVVGLVQVNATTTRIVRLDESTFTKGNTGVGVIGPSGKTTATTDVITPPSNALRVNLVGYVDVKVRGPVRDFDMIYADLYKTTGVATANPGPHPLQCLVGQAFGVPSHLAAAAPDSVQLVRCLISPPSAQSQLSAKAVGKLTSSLTRAIGAEIQGAGQTKASSVADLAEGVRNIKVEVPVKVSNESTATKPLLRRVKAVEDQMVVAFLMHTTGKALRAIDSGIVDGRGDCNNTSSLFVAHVVSNGSATTPKVMQLQSVDGDSAWLRIASDTGVMGVTDDVDARATLLQVEAVGNGAYVLRAAGCGTRLSTPDCRDGHFTIYTRS
eukprot:m.882891 g.882891  ORF g.882891 m.882891 type:complete len:900 (+) comp23599_c0_seq1:345-3044(+)